MRRKILFLLLKGTDEALFPWLEADPVSPTLESHGGWSLTYQAGHCVRRRLAPGTKVRTPGDSPDT
jgi:hypothetical protein